NPPARRLRPSPTRRSSDLVPLSISARWFDAVTPEKSVNNLDCSRTFGIEDNVSTPDVDGVSKHNLIIYHQHSNAAKIANNLFNRSEEHTSELQSRENLVCR